MPYTDSPSAALDFSQQALSPAPSEGMSLDHAIRASLEQYFCDLGDSTPHAMYDMMLKVVEKPLLEIVLTQAEGNQSRAAQWLGLNRNTLRKKLTELGIA